jgi:phosphatidylglycerol:prolipoprotein diacylglycerol transferase
MEATFAVPFFHLGSWDIGIPIQAFGVIVAAGVLIGAALLRRYGEWHGVSDEQIRGLTGWITVTGFLGAHWFNAIAYEWDKLVKDPLLFFKLWDGISSYGGFIGGAAGFAIYVWWKRLPARLFADIAIVGLLPAFSIGRIGCTVVSDHVGAFVDKTQWYAALAMNYPRDPQVINLKEVQDQVALHPATDGDTHILLWNLGFVELLYLIPVNAFILWYAFRPAREENGKFFSRGNTGMIAVITGVLYAPVRFFMDFLRPEGSDPRIAFGLTFAQLSSILAFGVAVYVLMLIRKNGKPDTTITRTAGEAQARLRVILKDEDEKEKDTKEPSKAKTTPAKKRPPTDDDDEDDDEDKKPAAKKPLKPVETAPTEPSIDALPKDFVEQAKAAKQAEDAADAKKAEQVQAKKTEDKKTEDKKTEDKKTEDKK